jgi:hypothetical protein
VSAASYPFSVDSSCPSPPPQLPGAIGTLSGHHHPPEVTATVEAPLLTPLFRPRRCRAARVRPRFSTLSQRVASPSPVPYRPPHSTLLHHLLAEATPPWAPWAWRPCRGCVPCRTEWLGRPGRLGTEPGRLGHGPFGLGGCRMAQAIGHHGYSLGPVSACALFLYFLLFEIVFQLKIQENKCKLLKCMEIAVKLRKCQINLLRIFVSRSWLWD